MVFGRWTQKSGVASVRGDSGPKAPMVLGTKRRSLWRCATSKTLCRPPMFTWIARGTFFSPTELSRALKWTIQSMPFSTTTACRLAESRTST